MSFNRPEGESAGPRAPASSFHDVLDGLGQRENVLDHVSAEERAELIRHGAVKRYKSGQPVFTQGAVHDYSYFILSGVISTTYLSYNGKEYTVAYWSKGDLVGGPYFLTDASMYLWSGRAVELTDVLAIPGGTLRALSRRIPSLAVAIIDALSYKIHWFSLLLQIMATQSIDGRLGALLLGLGKAYGVETPDGLLIRHPFTQTDLAQMIGVSRQWVNHALGGFQKRGVLSLVKGRILIRNRPALYATLGPAH